MKKLAYLYTIMLGLAFTGCEPMEEIHEEVDTALEQKQNAGTVDYTFTEDDYDEVELDNGYFTSVEQANELVPGFLDEMYPVLEGGSIANVTIEVVSPIEAGSGFDEYEVTEEDYDEMGLRYGNFDNEGDLHDFLDLRFPEAEAGHMVELTYEWYSGGTSTETNTFLKAEDGSWNQILALDSEDYQAMEEAFANFDNRAEAMQKLPIYLGELFPYAAANDTQDVLFEVHVGGGETEAYLKTFTFNGTRWEGSFETTLQFGHNGDEWEPDNTIVYTLADPVDYEFIGNALIEEYPNPAGNVRQYSSFERREGYNNYWSDEMLYEGIALLLEEIDPTAEEGQKYVVTVTTYFGGYGTESFSLIKEDGEWVPNEL